MSRKNRSMEAKYIKSVAQRIEAAQAEATKAVYLTPRTPVPAYDAASVRRVGMVRDDRQLKAIVNGIEVIAWKRAERAQTMRQCLRAHW